MRNSEVHFEFTSIYSLYELDTHVWGDKSKPSNFQNIIML